MNEALGQSAGVKKEQFFGISLFSVKRPLRGVVGYKPRPKQLYMTYAQIIKQRACLWYLFMQS